LAAEPSASRGPKPSDSQASGAKAATSIDAGLVEGGSISHQPAKIYLVAILFIIFDLEVSFLFPWAVALRDLGLYGYWSAIVFLGVLTIGFIYEWRKGALEWD